LVESFHQVPKPQKRKAHGTTAPGKRSRKLSGSVETRDKIGAFAGVSGRTVEKIAQVVEAAKAEPPRFRGSTNFLKITAPSRRAAAVSLTKGPT
jgi:hypothetical protein